MTDTNRNPMQISLDQHGVITATTDRHHITIRPQAEIEPWTAIFVEDPLAETVDADLAALAAQEANLGDRRWAQRGMHPEVDALYDRLNARIGVVKTAIAAEVLRTLNEVFDNDVERAAAGVRFSRHAGCRMCPCSPGVMTDGALTVGGVRVNVWIAPLA